MDSRKSIKLLVKVACLVIVLFSYYQCSKDENWEPCYGGIDEYETIRVQNIKSGDTNLVELRMVGGISCGPNISIYDYGYYFTRKEESMLWHTLSGDDKWVKGMAFSLENDTLTLTNINNPISITFCSGPEQPSKWDLDSSYNEGENYLAFSLNRNEPKMGWVKLLIDSEKGSVLLDEYKITSATNNIVIGE